MVLGSSTTSTFRSPTRALIPYLFAPAVNESTASSAPASSPITNVLAERYASAAMKDIWSQTGRVKLERDFWIAVMKGQRDLGVPIPAEAIKDYERVKDQIDLASIDKRERITLHDVKARIEEFSDLAKRQFIHLGLTSRDLTENVEQLQVFRALKSVHFKSAAALLGAVLTGTLLVGLLERRNPVVLRIGYDTLAILVLFLSGVGRLFTLR